MQPILLCLKRAALILLPGASLAAILSGWRGAAGFSCGLGVGAFSIASFLFLSSALTPMRAGPPVMRLTLVFALVKAPLFYLVAFQMNRLGSVTLAWFLGGLTLVYSLLVHTAVRE